MKYQSIDSMRKKMITKEELESTILEQGFIQKLLGLGQPKDKGTKAQDKKMKSVDAYLKGKAEDLKKLGHSEESIERIIALARKKIQDKMTAGPASTEKDIEDIERIRQQRARLTQPTLVPLFKKTEGGEEKPLSNKLQSWGIPQKVVNRIIAALAAQFEENDIVITESNEKEYIKIISEELSEQIPYLIDPEDDEDEEELPEPRMPGMAEPEEEPDEAPEGESEEEKTLKQIEAEKGKIKVSAPISYYLKTHGIDRTQRGEIIAKTKDWIKDILLKRGYYRKIPLVQENMDDIIDQIIDRLENTDEV